MHIPQRTWDKTHIGQLFQIFPGLINDKLQHSTPQQLMRAQEHISLIFWRWYFFLIHTSFINNNTPYMYAMWRKTIEKWPPEGMFLPQVTLELKKNTNTPTVQTQIHIEYISFHEQPLLIDLHRLRKGLSPIYTFDSRYPKDVSNLASLMQEIGINKKTKETDYIILCNYIDTCLLSMWIAHPDISKACTQEQWLTMWENILHSLLKTDEDQGFGSNKLEETYIDLMRIGLNSSSYGYTSTELQNLKGKRPSSKRAAQWRDLWAYTAYFILVPLSTYTQLIAPVFTDQENFHCDIQDVLDSYYDAITPLHGPFNTLHITPFGKKIFSYYLQHKNM